MKGQNNTPIVPHIQAKREDSGAIGNIETAKKVEGVLDNNSSDYIELLLRDRANAIPGELCFLYNSMIFDYAVKTVTGENRSNLTDYQEQEVKKQIENCKHCFYDYMDIMKMLEETKDITMDDYVNNNITKSNN